MSGTSYRCPATCRRGEAEGPAVEAEVPRAVSGTALAGEALRPWTSGSGAACTLPPSPMYEARTAATRTPAGFFPGADIGLLRRGDRADVLVLDDALDIHDILSSGELLER